MAQVVSFEDIKLQNEYKQIVNYPIDEDNPFDYFDLLIASDEIMNSSKYMLKLISIRRARIHHASEALRDNEKFMEEAVKHDKFGFKSASNRLKCNTNFASLAIELCVYNIVHVNPLNLMYEHLVVEALTKDGCILDMLSDWHRGDFDTVLVAIRNDGTALRYASSKLQENEVLALEAVKNNGSAINILPPYLQARADIITASKKSIEAINRKFGFKHNVVEFKKNRKVNGV